MIGNLQSIGNTTFGKSATIAAKEANMLNADNEADSFENKNAKAAENNDKIGFFRLAFQRLTPAQIANINETGRLPEGSKLVSNGYGGYAFANNIVNVTPGTRTLPATHEIKRNFLGFTLVVPKDTESLLIKK